MQTAKFGRTGLTVSRLGFGTATFGKQRTQCRLVLEGRLVAPWAAELKTACERAKEDLNGRELVVEVKNLTAINQAGENVLLDLMNDIVKLCGNGVFTKHILKHLTQRSRRDAQEVRQ